MDMKYYLSITAQGTVRIYVQLTCLSGVLEAWLNKHCIHKVSDMDSNTSESWEFNRAYYDMQILQNVMESHGCEFDDYPSNQSWL